MRCAVRFLRASAEEYGIDSDRFGAIGFSAGGRLSMMLGTMDIPRKHVFFQGTPGEEITIRKGGSSH